MTLSKYTPSQNFQQRLLKNTGFPLTNPHSRQPVQNELAIKINSLKTPHKSRADQLIAARGKSIGYDRQLALAVCLAGSFVFADTAPVFADAFVGIGSELTVSRSTEQNATILNHLVTLLKQLDWQQVTLVLIAFLGLALPNWVGVWQLNRAGFAGGSN